MEVRSSLWFVMGELTDDSGATTCDIRGGTGSAWEGGEPILTDVDWIDTEHLLIATDGGDIGTNTETRTDELFLDGTQVVHSSLVVHSITHIQNLLTTAPLLNGDVSETLHLPLRGHFYTGNKFIRLEIRNLRRGRYGLLRRRCRANAHIRFSFLTKSSTGVHETGYGHERNGISHSYFLPTFLLTYLC
jgi:hypothetical protein